MAGWYDYLQTEISSRRYQPRATFRPQRPWSSLGGARPSDLSRSGARRLGAPVGGSDFGKPDAYQPAAPPERFDFSLPFSKPPVTVPPVPTAPATPQPSTEGDILGSVSGAIGSMFTGGVNIANAIPWVMERTHEFAKGLAAENEGNAIGSVAGAGAEATGAFLGAVEQVSEVAGPILDALPNYYRDNQLRDRAQLYRAILSGDTEAYGPLGLGGFFESGSLLPGTQSVRDKIPEFLRWRQLFEHSVDPEAKLDAETRLALLRDSIDLPQSVKDAIARNPRANDDQLEQMLNAAPEGRQWSYDPGFGGMYANTGNMLLFYGAEAIALNRLGVGAGAAARQSVIPALTAPGRLGAASKVLATTLEGAARATTVAAKLQKYAMLSGGVTAALTTGVNAVARYQGNQAAIDWLDKVTQTGDFAENPHVQLVTGFTVNPFAAVGALSKGTLRLASGTGNIVISRALGTKLLRFYNADDMIYGQLAKMYKLDGPAEAKAFAGNYYGGKGEVFDEVVGLASDHVLDRLPREERIAFIAAHNDAESLTRGVLTQYGAQVWDALENHSDEIAQRFFDKSWRYHQYPGAFNADVMALNALDFRGAKARTAALRAEQDAVVGYQDHLPPEGVALARSIVDRAPGDAIPVVGLGGVQDLVRQFPALRKHWQGLVDPKAPTVPKSSVDAMLERASRDYADTFKHNPVKVRTGADPVLRPNSPRLKYDYAEALGTDVDTFDAIFESGGKPDAAQLAKLREFLVAKTDLDPAVAAGLSPDDVFARAFTYADETTAPWVEAGTRVVAAEQRITALRTQLQRLHAKTQRTMQDREAMGRIETELGQLQRLTREASDPIRPFSEDVRLEALRSRNADRVRAMDPDHLTANQEKFLRRYLSDESRGIEVADDVTGRDLWEQARDLADAQPSLTGRDARLMDLAERKVAAMRVLDDLSLIDDEATVLVPDGEWQNLLRPVEGNWRWSGGKPPMTTGMRRSLSRIFDQQGHGVLSREIMTMGDEEAWGILRDRPEALAALSRTQRNAVTRAVAESDVFGSTLDEYADRAIRNGTVRTSEEYLERLIPLAERRASLLEGGSLRQINLRRTAGIDVPPEYVAAAEADMAAMAHIYDPTFEAVTHPANIGEVQKILASPDELYPALRGVVDGDPILRGKVIDIARRRGASPENLLTDATNADALRELVPPDFEPPTPGVVIEQTPLDAALIAGDADTIAGMSEQLRAAADGPHEPIVTTRALARRATTKLRPSSEWRRKLTGADADLTASPSAAIMDDPANRIGLDVLSVLNHGVAGTRPATIGRIHLLLREIETGGGTRMGIGASAQAEGQRVANLLLRDGLANAKRAGIRPGRLYVKGGGLDPAMMGEDDLILARALEVEEARGVLRSTLGRDVIREGQEEASKAANVKLGVLKGGTAESGGAVRAAPETEALLPPGLRSLGAKITYDPGDPLGTLQYGLKKRPSDAVVMELSQVPGLAEEFVTKRFQPWSERVWTAHSRRLFNYLFGAHPNEAIHGAVYQAFVERMARAGIDGDLAESVWKRWREKADKSRNTEVRVDPRTGVRQHVPGDNPLYASVANIPNNEMDRWAHEAIDEALRARGAKQSVDPAYRQMAHTLDYSTIFRESSSNMRRWLLGEQVRIGSLKVPSPVPTPLGKALAGAYGMAAHNRAVTTMYYWFRFGLDIRFHAMNFFESQILYAGRAGLRKGEIDTGLLGQTEGFLRRMDTDFMNNTGYATSRARFAMAYRTMLKEQPDKLRGAIKGLQSEDPELMEQVLRELADADPQIRDMIVGTGGTPDGWVKAMDEWHGKMLKAATEQDADVVIDDAIAKMIGDTPAMAEVYSTLAQANKDLWRDIRSTFYGNPDRSRAERFLNSYLLFWPLSYQVKASKWMLRVMYDRAGGLPTNAAGAVILDRAAQTHQQLLATDPEYRDWYEKHETLVFMAQMLMPITPSSMGVSLNPALRSMFFGRTKAIWDIGPVYTLTNLLPRAGEEVAADLYPTLKDVPGLGPVSEGLYRTLTGRKVPELD